MAINSVSTLMQLDQASPTPVMAFRSGCVNERRFDRLFPRTLIKIVSGVCETNKTRTAAIGRDSVEVGYCLCDTDSIHGHYIIRYFG